MRVRSKSLWLLAFFLAITVFVLATVVDSTVSFVLTYPGILFTWPFWPEGIHTGTGGVPSAVGFYLVFALGNVVVWTLLVRGLFSLIVRLRREPAIRS